MLSLLLRLKEKRSALILVGLALPLSAQEEPPHRSRSPLPTPAEIADLPPDGGPEFNRLVFEHSPYLLQHARNPVDWYPWGEAAFERARAEDKPVFLSIGYSTCHWCHVMEHESFEDEEVAKLLNEHFVCVKVDREERPDIDQVYMTYTQALTGRGGWPMTVLMTPEKKPFFAGTYFPKKGRAGMPGMLELVPGIAHQWDSQREAIGRNADQAVSALQGMSQGTPGEGIGSAVLERAGASLAQAFDARQGGFGGAPKFPIPHQLSFLLRQHARSGNAHALEMVGQTLAAMRRGGIWDHVGFGFHRYSTDARWLVPHFEKMLYDQALMAIACVEAFQITGEEEYRSIAELTFRYVLRDMTAPEGGFYSAEDADSEGEEGLFYVWTTAELEALLGAEDAALAASYWSASAEGNFREEATGAVTGRNILHQSRTPAEVAAAEGLELDELARRIESIRVRLFDAREARVHPLKDDKILTDWNGLMIAALSKAARAFDAPEYGAAAQRAADFALRELRDEEGRLYKRHRMGDSALPGMLEDHAFLAWGLLELYETSFETRYLRAARELADSALEHFADDERGGFFLSPDDGEELIVRTKETYDGAIPSGNSVMVANLLRLGRITAEVRYEEAADAAMRAFAGDVARNPSAYTMLLGAADFALGPSFEIVIAGDPGADDTRAMLAALGHAFLPNKVVVLRPPGEAPEELLALAPYVEAQVALDGRATAYVCRDFTCRAPTVDIEEMLRSIREQAEGR